MLMTGQPPGRLLISDCGGTRFPCLGPSVRYYANASKTWLVIKKEFQAEVNTLFGDNEVKITSEGCPHLDAPLDIPDYVSQYVSEKVQQWSKELKLLSAIAITKPHATFAAYTHGLASKWSYLCRTTPFVSPHLKVLEDVLRTEFIPNLTGRPSPNDALRKLLALPARLGGLGISNPSLNSDDAFKTSLLVTVPLKKLIQMQDSEYTYQAYADQMTAKADMWQKRCEQATTDANSLRDELTPTLQKAIDLARERGSSSWLTSLPLKEHDFVFHKGIFVDALALRYGWIPSRTPSSCECRASFTVEHVLSFPRGGFPSIRHNEIRDITANLLTEVCHDVQVEPDL